MCFMLALAIALFLAASSGAAPHVYPDATPPLNWSVKTSFAWVTPMPSNSVAAPVLAGGKLFVVAEPDALLCVNAADGKVLWQKRNGTGDVLTPDSTKEYRDRCRKWFRVSVQRFEAELAKVRADRKLMDAPDDQEQRGISAKNKTLYHKLEGERGKYPRFRRHSVKSDVGTAAATPLVGGNTVYVVYGTGVMVAYDFAGNRKWSKFLGPVTLKEGQTMAPVMAGNVLGLHFENVFAGLDPATGKTRWEIGHGRDLSPKMPGAPSGTPWGMPEGFFITTRAGIRKASDGAHLGKFGALPHHGPVVAEGKLWWFSDKRELYGKKLNISNGKAALERHALRVPLCDPESKRKFSLHKGPLIHAGLAYVWDRSGTLIIIDLKAGKVVFDRNVGVGESDASPVLASRFIYLTGNNGTCVVLEQRSKKIETKPGKFIRRLIFPEVARNRLEPCRSGPIFVGDRMYLRGQKHFYCVKTSAADKKRGETIDQGLEDMADDIEQTVDDDGGMELE